jgi:NTP pyrophosphatase (non-canonical NTP hydrolase)
MNFEEYADFVTKMASVDATTNFSAKLTHGALGLAGEAGEVADLAKKVIFHGMQWDESIRQKMINELADIFWYLTFTARNVLNVTIEEIMEANVKKLQERYKTGKFTTAEFLIKENQK